MICVISVNRFFKEKNPKPFCEPAQQVLRALVNKIPSKVRKAQYILSHSSCLPEQLKNDAIHHIVQSFPAA
jgi:hypothetical protein